MYIMNYKCICWARDDSCQYGLYGGRILAARHFGGHNPKKTKTLFTFLFKIEINPFYPLRCGQWQGEQLTTNTN